MKQSRFAQYAAEELRRRFLGKLIKFVKGEWQMGLNRDPIWSSQRFVAVMDTLTIGYMKWVGGEIVDHKMGLVADGFRAAHRNDLDDLGGENWEASEYGDRIDPWQKTRAARARLADRAPRSLYLQHEHGGRGERDRRLVRGARREHRRRWTSIRS